MSVTDDAVARLRTMIVSGELRPGDRLPRETDLAADLGVSRNSLREAVRVLSVLGILDVRQGNGTYVTDLTSQTLQHGFMFIADFYRDSARFEFLEIRRMLEPIACARAAGNATPESIAALTEIADRVSVESSLEEIIEADRAFHQTIARMCDSVVLASLLEVFSGPIVQLSEGLDVGHSETVRQILDEHRAIVEAISRGDIETAGT